MSDLAAKDASGVEQPAEPRDTGHGLCGCGVNGNHTLAALEPVGIAALSELSEAIAKRVVELLGRPDRQAKTGLATAEELAEQLGVRKSWVYANQERLGAIRLGDGPKARLRFDLEQATSAVHRQCEPSPPPPRRPGRPRKSAALPAGVELLAGRRG